MAAATDLAAEACVPMPFTSSMPAWSSPSSNLWLALEQVRLHWGGGSRGLRGVAHHYYYYSRVLIVDKERSRAATRALPNATAKLGSLGNVNKLVDDIINPKQTVVVTSRQQAG